MADALDSKSSIRKNVWVQVPPPVLQVPQRLTTLSELARKRQSHHDEPLWGQQGANVASTLVIAFALILRG